MQLCTPTPLCGQERRDESSLLHCTLSSKMLVALGALGNTLKREGMSERGKVR